MALKDDPDVFRKLSKNDIEQTPDQWEEKTLHKLGESSGLWVSWVRRRQMPKVPDEVPEPPVKPSSESLMSALKTRLRREKFIKRVETDIDFATEGKVDDIPLPDDYEAWQEYERMKTRHQLATREYERAEKLALETFPNENRKVFSALIDCISEASVQDLKRSKEGSKFYEECDAYNFLQLAMKEHQYISPGVLSAAVARAKDEFERYRQKSEDSITQHVNEYRRKLEVYVKARGPGQPSPYADFDLRDLLLRSLYQPTWAGWIESRYVNDNMPATFEDLVLALKKAETTKILRASSPIDPFQPTSHATSSLMGTTPPGSPGPVKCATCGTMFCAKRAGHTRCDKCQEEYVNQKKKERKKLKEKEGKKKSKNKTVKEKRAHATGVDTVEDGDSEDEEEEDDDYLNKGTSFSCICSTRATSSISMIYLDNCSNLNVIKDKELALNIQKEKVATRISGSIPGTLTAQVSAELGDLGRGCYDPKFSRNLISEYAAIRAGYTITRDSSADNKYYLRKVGCPPLVFSANDEGTFSITVHEFKRHFNRYYGGVSNMTDVNRREIVFTKRQRERAAVYHFDHSHSLSHLHHERVIMALRKGLITNVPYTESDVRNALIIYGPCAECSSIKGTRHRQVGHYPVLPDAPGERLAGDLFTIGGVLFSLISCRLIKLKCVTRLQNKSASEITRTIRECVNIWRGYGARPKVLSWDQEPALVHCAAEIWAQHSLRVEHTSPDAHERVAEREVRTVKEHVYATIKTLGHAVDAEMIEGIVRDTVTLLNFFPNSETLDGTPRTFLDGERLDYGRWSRVYAGQVAEFEIPYAKQMGKGLRKELGYVIGHQGDNPVVRLLPSGKKLVVRSAHINVIAKTQGIIELIERGIQGAKRQQYNDLISEIRDFEEDPSKDERHSDEPTMRILRDDATEPLVITPLHETVPDNREETVVNGNTETVNISSPSEETNNQNDEMSPEERPTITRERIDTPRNESQPTVLPAAPLRRSARSGALKSPGYYAKLHAGENIADYTACHLRAHECSRLYGENVTKKAGITEVVNMIKTRQAAEPQDYRKLSRQVIEEAVSSFMFFKAKDTIPSEDALKDLQPEASGDETNATSWSTVKSKRIKRVESLKNGILVRGRWVGGGNEQERDEVLAERVSPTARGTTHSILMGIAGFEGRQLLVGDIPSAYLQAEHVPANGKPVYIIADRYVTRLIVESMPEYQNFVRPNGTMILKVKKAMYGLVESAWLWYKEFEKHLLELGYNVSSCDRGLFYKKVFRQGRCVGSNIASVHVDDIISAASPNEEGKKLETEFWSSMEKRWPGIKLQRGPSYKHLSWNIKQDKVTGVIRKCQKDYLVGLVKECGVEKEHKLPCRSDILTSDPASPKLDSNGVTRFRSILQKIAYARDGRPDFDFVVCYLQSKQSAPTEQDWNDLQHLLGYVRRFPEREVVIKPVDMQLRGAADASFNITQDGRSYYGYAITLGHSLISAKGGRIKTVVRSSTEAEISAVNEIASEILWCRDLLEELGYKQDKIPIQEDNKSCITMLQKEPRSFHSKSRHVRVKWAFFRQEYARRTLYLSYCPTDKMVADLLTKPTGGKVHNLHTKAMLEGCVP